MVKQDRTIKVLYGSAAGRALTKGLLAAGAPRLIASYLRSPASRPRIKRFIRKNGIDMTPYEKKDYASFADFFVRKKENVTFDGDPASLISPCDAYLSFCPIEKDGSFIIKGTPYSLRDLIGETEDADALCGGLCLIFRLSVKDYHRYIWFDGGYVGDDVYTEGKLHSVQPICCEKYPVYRLNRRRRQRFESDGFGLCYLIEVGALAVGGIVNEAEDRRVARGEEMGHFELCGSTVVLLLGKERAELLPEIKDAALKDGEVKVRQGEVIGRAAEQ